MVLIWKSFSYERESENFLLFFHSLSWPECQSSVPWTTFSSSWALARLMTVDQTREEQEGSSDNASNGSDIVDSLVTWVTVLLKAKRENAATNNCFCNEHLFFSAQHPYLLAATVPRLCLRVSLPVCLWWSDFIPKPWNEISWALTSQCWGFG